MNSYLSLYGRYGTSRASIGARPGDPDKTAVSLLTRPS